MKIVRVVMCKVYENGANEEVGRKYVPEAELLEMISNAEAILNNKRRKLAGYHSVVVFVEPDGRKLAGQVSGYNGHVGMYGYMVNPDNTLTKFF